LAETCSELYNLYISDPKTNGREVSQDINRFIQWCGKTTSIHRLTPHTIASYAEWIGIQGGDVSKKLTPVKAFLAYLRKHEIIQINLATHLRAPKTRTKSQAAAAAVDRAELTREGYDELVARLNALKNERVQIVEDIGRAMADKDFRENAPLDAAKERQGFTESMIRNLEHTLSKAVIRDSTSSKRQKFVAIGTKVTLKNLGRSEKATFTLVHPSEANLSEGKLSSESPVGKALLNRRKGDEVEVIIPKGTIRYKLERIEN
tara:strand:- start:137 stop:922 length:786 start_codon:yes stop_codon:yes gene_type:complete